MELAVCEKCAGEGCKACKRDGAVFRADTANCPSIHHVRPRLFRSGDPAPETTDPVPRGPHVRMLRGETWRVVVSSWRYGSSTILDEGYARGVGVGLSLLRPRRHMVLVDRELVLDEWPAIDRAPDRPGRECIHLRHEPAALASWRLTVQSQIHLHDVAELPGLRKDAEALEAVEDLLFELHELRMQLVHPAK